MSGASRRTALRAFAGLAAGAAFGGGAHAAEVVLRVGDQKGGAKSVLDAADGLRDLSYRIEWSEFPAAAPLLEALNADAIDTGGVGDAPLIFAQAAGAQVAAISATQANPEGTAIIVPAASPIRDAAGLRGKRIGTGRGSIGHFLALAVLERAGLARDATIAFLSPADAKAALTSGAIDAWSTWEPYTSLAQIVDRARAIADGRGISTGYGFVVASAAAIASKRNALADYARRLNAARRWAGDHLGVYARSYALAIGVPEAVARQALGRRAELAVAIDDTLAAAQQRTADAYLAARVIREPIDVNRALDRSFQSALGFSG